MLIKEPASTFSTVLKDARQLCSLRRSSGRARVIERTTKFRVFSSPLPVDGRVLGDRTLFLAVYVTLVPIFGASYASKLIVTISILIVTNRLLTRTKLLIVHRHDNA